MKNHTEPFTSVPELRQQVFEQWYAAEWQERRCSTSRYSQVTKHIVHLSGTNSRLLQPLDKPQSLQAKRTGLRRVLPLKYYRF